MMLRAFVTAIALFTVVLGLAAAGEARTVITGIVKSKAGQPLPGLALLEKGEIHRRRHQVRGRRFRLSTATPRSGKSGLPRTPGTLPSGDQSIASVTIFDAQGHVVRVVKDDHRLRRERWSHVNHVST